MGRTLVLLQMFGAIKKTKDLGVNIFEEFRLIQDKKSKLSKAQRDSVVYQFNLHYEKVETD